jgi:hypothetical protein
MEVGVGTGLGGEVAGGAGLGVAGGARAKAGVGADIAGYLLCS